MNQIPNIEEEFENYIYQLYQQYFSLEEKGLIPHTTHSVTDSVNFEEIVAKHKDILLHQLQKARQAGIDEVMDIVKEIKIKYDNKRSWDGVEALDDTIKALQDNK